MRKDKTSKPKPRVRSQFLGATADSHGITFAGVRYSAEQSKVLEAICRERNVSMTEAVDILRREACR